MQELRQRGCVLMRQFGPYSSSWKTVEMRAATGWSSFTPPETNFEQLNKSESILYIILFTKCIYYYPRGFGISCASYAYTDMKFVPIFSWTLFVSAVLLMCVHLFSFILSGHCFSPSLSESHPAAQRHSESH